MKKLFITSMLLAMTTINSVSAQSQQLELSKVKAFEQQLDDVMEIIDTTLLKSKLKEVEADYSKNSNEINKARLGIIYHETALNLSFFSKTEYKGYAQKSYDILTEMLNAPNTTKELLPFIASFRASAISLVGAETSKLKFIGQAFTLFSEAVEKYGAISYLPEYLRGSVAENLPWYFYFKKRSARHDFQSIIEKQAKNADYANWKIMSFTYWAWAKQHQSSGDRTQALQYLDKAISLDPNYKGGRAKAEALKAALAK
jgi:tetratricopeptide (TPR) repeat protein